MARAAGLKLRLRESAFRAELKRLSALAAHANGHGGRADAAGRLKFWFLAGVHVLLKTAPLTEFLHTATPQITQ